MNKLSPRKALHAAPHQFVLTVLQRWTPGAEHVTGLGAATLSGELGPITLDAKARCCNTSYEDSALQQY